MRIVIPALAAALAVACGHSSRQVSPAFALQDRTAQQGLSGDERIIVTDGDLEVPHRAIAFIQSATYRRELLESEGVADLRREATRVGADAVIRVHAEPQVIEELAHRPGQLLRVGTQWITVYSLRGQAVRLSEEAPRDFPAEPPAFNLPD